VDGEVEPERGGAPDEFLVLQTEGGLELDEQPGRICSGGIERADVPVAAGDEQLGAAQVRYEICRVVRLPDGPLRRRVAEERERVVPERGKKRLQHPGRIEPGEERVDGGVEGVEHSAERGGGSEEAGPAAGVRHGAEAAHRETGDSALIGRVESPLEDLAKLDEMERLPAGLAPGAVIPPVGVKAEAAAVGHDDEQVALAREV